MLLAEMEYGGSAATMLVNEIWQIAEEFVKVPANLYAQLKNCSKQCGLSQIRSEENFVKETLIVSTMWKAPWDIFHNVVSSI